MLQTIERTTKDLEIRGYPQQTEFITDSSFISAFIAGFGAGKTHSGASKSLLYCLAHPGAWGIVTAPTYGIMEVGTLPVYQRIFPPEIIIHQRNRPRPEWDLINNSKLFFWSTDKPEMIVAGEVAFAHMDEASLSPYLAYSNVKKRLRQMDSKGQAFPYQLWVTTTPRQLNWLYKEITSKTDPIHTISASTRDNIYLEDVEGYIQRMGLTGKDYEEGVEGKFVDFAGECLFDKAVLEMQLHNCIPPIIGRPLTSIWKEAVVGVKYIAAADCSDEGGEGVNNLVIADSQTGELVAEIYGDIKADKFAELSFNLLGEYSNPVFAPERNGTVGGIVLQKFKDMGYSNLFKDDKDKEGWYTTPTALPPKISRFTMLKEFEEALRLRRWIERSSDAIGEMSTFIRDNNGKYKARSGYKDDRVMARAICWQMRKASTTVKRGECSSFSYRD